tara:strand:- start:1096 stop:1926 length:831 start_codon:yes stop_codon:yes gene_type:complete
VSYKYDVSIMMPAIRTSQWLMMYGSLINACQKYSWELVLVSPFDLPDNMKHFENIKMIKDYGAPSRCAQIGAIACEGEFLYHCVDDAIFLPEVIDNAVDWHRQHCSDKDVINMRYREGAMFSGQTLPEQFWLAWFHDELRLPGIPQHYKISCHHFMKLDYFKQLGGWDCRYEYINHSLHDLMFRVQADGGRLYDSRTDATTCNHFIDKTGDHAPIYDAQTFHDKPQFDAIYAVPNAAASRITIPLDNWTQQPEVWERRFKEDDSGNLPESYEELGY